MRKIISIFILTGLFSCMPEEELPIKDMGAISGYFIECYCIPGEPYILNAAKILPLTEMIDPGAVVDLDVSIKADSVIQLVPVPGAPSFLGNYQHMTRMENYGIDSLFLSILTPENEHITAKTAVPEAIEISSYTVSQTTNSVSITFPTSRNPRQNYYIFSIQARKSDQDDPILKKETIYMDLSDHTPGTSIEKTIKCPQIEQADAVFITLMRITEACYNYQISLYEANSANQGSITTPVPLVGNIQGALGIFTCYTKDNKYIPKEKFN
ncbi:DUF4249 family protein [Butyricimonas hominis]|uniref:DUF4249 family protein n=2 Tax=Odoribacteraceae TaxID=1853231 RepID=A0ABR7CWI0_9BACT|nr:DUF4249 family protein [Butyricimonas hominis]MBC5620043.1 DUF4249 family protein [Butyricimonas hominis]